MRIAVLGAGYVGVVTAACFARRGHHVVVIEKDAGKVRELQAGRAPFYEPGLEEMLAGFRSSQAQPLRFTADPTAARDAQFVFICVGTPAGEDGDADLNALYGAVEGIAGLVGDATVIAIKSTVPPGTTENLRRRLSGHSVAANPEFLREGNAITDCLEPDRIVIGADDEHGWRRLEALYRDTGRPIVRMSSQSAELVKYATNAMLAVRISFANELADLAAAAGADIADVTSGLGMDGRIGPRYLRPGLGYGGSCLPKDVSALVRQGERLQAPQTVLAAVQAVNARRRLWPGAVLAERLRLGANVAIWGTAFKPGTDDCRNAAALNLIPALIRRGARIAVHDRHAKGPIRDQFGDRLRYAGHPLDAVEGADALAVLTEDPAFQQVSLADVRRRMAGNLVVDGWSLWPRDRMTELGFEYVCIAHEHPRVRSLAGTRADP